jgi:hypothetical protein
MDRIELAERRFRQVLPDSFTQWAGPRAREIETWLRDDVIAAVEEVCGRQAFRDQATWSLRLLAPGSGTAERRAVEAVDAALVASATALARLAEDWRGTAAPARMDPPREELVATDVIAQVDEPPTPWARAGRISRRPWVDLVCPLDYLEPHGGMMLRGSPPPAVTEGEFVVSLNPELHPVGDLVSRCMFRRVEVWQASLDEFRRLCYRDRAGRLRPATAEAERRASQDLGRLVSELRARCLVGPAAAIRDSCVIMTQVYAAFHPDPDLTWLSLPRYILESGRDVLRHRILRYRTSEPLERIAAALPDLRWLLPSAAPRRANTDKVIAAGGLVLVDRPKAAYWEGQRLVADWDRHAKPWEFLRALATKALLVASVGETDLYSEPKGASTMANRLARLKPLIPPTLRRRIIPAGLRAYRLHLDRGRIHLLETE